MVAEGGTFWGYPGVGGESKDVQIESMTMLFPLALLCSVLTIISFFVPNIVKGQFEILRLSRRLGCGF